MVYCKQPETRPISSSSGSDLIPALRSSAETDARSGDLDIAYQVVGQGPLDLVYVPGWVSHVELAWEEPALARFLNRLASFSRLIIFDKRGTGLSDRVPPAALPPLEERMDDMRAVMDAAGSHRSPLRILGGRQSQRPLRGLVSPANDAPMLFDTFATNPEARLSMGADAECAGAIRDVEREWGRA